MKKIMFGIITVSVLLLSCSKNNDDAGNQPVLSIKGKKLVFSDANYPTTFTYNADGTLNSYSYDVMGYSYKYTHTYDGDSVRYVGKDLATDKTAEIGAYGFTGAKVTGYSWWTCNSNGTPITNYTEKFIYNANGLLEKRTYQNAGYELYYYDGGGDLIKKEYYTPQGTMAASTSYTYYDKVDKFPWYGPLDLWFQSFIVNPLSKHLLKKKVYIDFFDPADNQENNYTYEFDADGYVIKGAVQMTRSQQTTTYEWHNTYQ
jgi:hypothetical protein